MFCFWSHGFASPALGTCSASCSDVNSTLFAWAYPAEYKDEPRWYALVCSYAPAIIVWLFNKAFLRRLVFVWILYMFCGLVPNIAIVLGFVGDSLDNNRFLGPITLKSALGLTPPILLLLVNTASDSNENRETVSKLSFRMTLNRFDSVDMIDIVLDEKEHGYGISKEFGKTIIVVACLSLLLSPWQLAENNIERGRRRNLTAILSNIFEIIEVNLAFLIIRLVIVFKYNKDESIFVAKNVITIILSVKEIFDLHRPLQRLVPAHQQP